MKKEWAFLLLATAMAAASPSAAQTSTGTPAFRVPLGQTTSASSGPATYAWMQNVATCSNTCGNGTRATTYQCQDVSNYDFGGAGYGAPEADSFCSATSPKPAASSVSCTNYSGCSYDWVKPATVVVRIAKPMSPSGTYPVGAIDDCSYAKRTFSPYCERGGSPSVQMPAGDHAFCKNDTPDYNDVANNVPDALGYDRTGDVVTGCVAGPRDHEWKTGTWSTSSSTCSSAPTQTRTVQCVLKFNGASRSDADCAGITKPATSQTVAADYSSCSYAWTTGGYGAYSSTCSSSATRTRSVTCTRSDGTTVADSSCSGAKPATTETAPNYVGCTYAWGTPTAWTYASSCSDSTSRSRTVSCQRSDGTVSADSNCPSGTKPTTYESGVSNTSGCTYTPRDMGRTACASSQQQQYWDCTRSDGQTGYPASMCGKTNPETVSCTMPPSYTYTPVNRGESACSGGQKNVYWDCTRSDGQTGFPASNCGKTNPEVQSCTMPYTYTPVNRGESACSGGQKNVYWDCTRSDGQTGFPASNCGKTNPEVQSCTMPYTYTPVYRGETACSGGQKQVYWDCTRSDGVTGFPASNCGKTNPETQTCTMPVTYAWNQGGWSGYNSSCSDNATRTRSVWCQGSDGQTYPDANCGGGKPASSETTGVYSGCGYASEDTSTTACSGGSQTVYMQCRRSDGVVVANGNCGHSGSRTQSCTMPTPDCRAVMIPHGSSHAYRISRPLGGYNGTYDVRPPTPYFNQYSPPYDYNSAAFAYNAGAKICRADTRLGGWCELYMGADGNTPASSGDCNDPVG